MRNNTIELCSKKVSSFDFAKVRDHIILPMVALYRRPPGTQGTVDDALSQYVEDLVEFAPAVLSQAWLQIRRKNPCRRYWPKVSEIYTHCIHIQSGHEKRVFSPTTTGARTVSCAKKKDMAFQYLRTQSGQQALNEGWGVFAYDYLVKTGGNSLMEAEIQLLRDKSYFLHKKRENLRLEGSALAKHLAGFIDSLETRNARLLEKVHAMKCA